MVQFNFKKYSALTKALLLIGAIAYFSTGVVAQDQALSCVGNTNLSMAECMVEVTPSMLSAAEISSSLDYEVSLEDPIGNSIPDNMLTIDHVGKRITAQLSIIDPSTDEVINTCWAYIFPEDKIGPIIPCIEDTPVVVACESPHEADGLLPYDNTCGPVDIAIIAEEILDECSRTIDPQLIKIARRTYKATDQFGNSSTCEQLVHITRLDLETDVIYPPASMTLQCDQFYMDEDGFPLPIAPDETIEGHVATGIPQTMIEQIKVIGVNPDGTPIVERTPVTLPLYPDNNISECRIVVDYRDSLLADFVCTKKIQRRWTIIENCYPFTAKVYTQIFSIVDEIAPVVTPLDDKSIVANIDNCTAKIEIPRPQTTDNCDENGLRYDVYIVRNPVFDSDGEYLDGDTIDQYINYGTDEVTIDLGLNYFLFEISDDCGNITETSCSALVEDVDGPQIPVCDDKIIGIPNTGEAHVKATSFIDEDEIVDCANPVIAHYVKRQVPGCDCEDDIPSFEHFTYIGERGSSRYFLSDQPFFASVAYKKARSMGGYVVTINNLAEHRFVRDAVREHGDISYLIGLNDLAWEDENEWIGKPSEFTYFPGDNRDNDERDYVRVIGAPDDEISSSITAAMFSQGRWLFYNGLDPNQAIPFVVEIDEACGFSEVLTICCEDIANDSLYIDYRAVDQFGNFSDCEVRADIQDKAPPVVLCLQDTTISCLAEISLDTAFLAAQFGLPTVLHECDVTMIVDNPVDNRANCNDGNIIRRFTITSLGGLSTRCEQVIHIEQQEGPDEFAFNAPDDFDTLACITSIDLSVENLAPRYVGTLNSDVICNSTFELSYDDQEFVVPGSQNSCFKIIRTWYVTKFCDTDFRDTLHQQSLVVSNNVSPDVALTPQTEMMVTVNNCDEGMITLGAMGSDDCTPGEDLIHEYEIDEFNDGTIDFTSARGVGVTVNASGTYPVGQHRVKFIYRDGCGNTTVLEHVFEIKSSVPPKARCQNLAMPLHIFDTDNDGVKDSVYMPANAEWFDLSFDTTQFQFDDISKIQTGSSGSESGCGGPITFSFSADTLDKVRIFDCNDLCELQLLDIYVTDVTSGAQSICRDVTLEIQDPKGVCDLPSGCLRDIPAQTTTYDICNDMLTADQTFIPISTYIDTDCCNDFTVDSTTTVINTGNANTVSIRKTYTLVTNCGCGEEETYTHTFVGRLDTEAPTCQLTSTNAVFEVGDQINVPFTVGATSINANISETSGTLNVRVTDNCGIQSIQMTPDDITCDVFNQTSRTITATVMDINGNSLAVPCTATIGVIENIDPTCVTRTRTVSLMNAGTMTVGNTFVDNGSEGGCDEDTPPTITLNKTNFNCNDLGSVNLTQTVVHSGRTATCQQAVTVRDCSDPTFTITSGGSGTIVRDGDITTVSVSATSAQCEFTFANTSITAVSACGETRTVSQDNFDGAFVAGLNTVNLSVTDVCGKTYNHQLRVIVEVTNVGQTFECKKQIFNIEENDQVVVNVSDIVCIEGGRCDGEGGLSAAFSRDVNDTTVVYTCSLAGRDFNQGIFIFDNGVAVSSCIPITSVRDPNGFCSSNITSGSSPIVGRIQSEDGVNIEGVSVALLGADDAVVQTDNLGSYAFDNMPLGGDYIVKPSKDDNARNGVSTLDLVLIQKHILGITDLDSPYKKLAADVNGNEKITTADLVLIRKLVLGQSESFPVSTWRFIDDNYEYRDFDDPFNSNLSEEYAISDLERPMFVNFVGVKMADVNYSHLGRLNTIETRDIGTPLVLDIQGIENGNYVDFQISSDDYDNIEGMQFTFNYDAQNMHFRNALSQGLEVDNGNVNMRKQGQIVVSIAHADQKYINGENGLFTLRFDRISDQKPKLIEVSSDYLEAEAYTQFVDRPIVSELTWVSDDVELLQNRPNPWAESTLLEFNLPTESDYMIRLFDVTGKQIYVKEGRGVRGHNAVEIRKHELSTPGGVIHYELITNESRHMKRMILTK